MQAITSWADVAFSSAERDRHLGSRPVSQLDTWPVASPVNASRRPSRDAAHHSGSGWLARPSPWGTCTSYSLPANWRTPLRVTPGRTQVEHIEYASPPKSGHLADMPGRPLEAIRRHPLHSAFHFRRALDAPPPWRTGPRAFPRSPCPTVKFCFMPHRHYRG